MKGRVLRSRGWLIIVAVCVAVAGGVYLGSLPRSSGVSGRGSVRAVGAPRSSAASGAPVAVDALAAAPDAYPGRVIVSGAVTSVDAKDHTFILGCSDACVAVPVRYSGQPPSRGAQVLVTGAISKGPDGKRVFVASVVSPAR